MNFQLYAILYTELIFLIWISQFIKLKEYYLIIVFFFVYLLNAFRIDSINEDSLNYLFYFSDVKAYKNFSNLMESFGWIKIEIGFKALLFTISHINIFSSSLMFKLVISVINLSIFYYIFLSSKKRNINNFLLFIFFYICFFIFIFDLAIIRFSLSSLIFLLIYYKLFYTNYNKITLVLMYVLSASFHLSGMLYGIVFYYFYFIIFSEKKFKTFFLALPFIIIFFSLPLLMIFASNFGDYYVAMFKGEESRFSIRILIEFLFLLRFYLNNKKKKLYLFLLILYIFFSFVEVYLGIYVLNRFRIITWLLFLYSVSVEWSNIEMNYKLSLIVYSLSFYMLQLQNMLQKWS